MFCARVGPPQFVSTRAVILSHDTNLKWQHSISRVSLLCTISFKVFALDFFVDSEYISNRLVKTFLLFFYRNQSKQWAITWVRKKKSFTLHSTYNKQKYLKSITGKTMWSWTQYMENNAKHARRYLILSKLIMINITLW